MVDKEYIVQTQVQGLDQVEQLNDELKQTDSSVKQVGSTFSQTSKKVEGSMKNTAEQAGAGFERLQSQLRKTQTDLQAALDVGDAKAIKDLRATLGDLEDQLDVAKIKSQQFDDVLAGLPGPAGAAGNAIKSVDGAFKLLAANPVVAVIGVIAGLFLALRESLSRTEEGQAKLNKITEGFEKILNGLFAVLEPIANLFIDLVTGLLENKSVMEGLSVTVGVVTGAFNLLFGIVKNVYEFVVGNLINGFKTLINTATAVANVIEGVFTFDFDKVKKGAKDAFDAVANGIKTGVNNTVNLVKGVSTSVVDGFVDGFKAGEKGFNEGINRLTEKQKEVAKKNAEKAKEIQKKAKEDAIKAAEDLALAKTKTEQEQADVAYKNQLANLKRQYDAEIKAAKEVGADTTDITKAYNAQKAKAEVDYQNQTAKIKKDAADKEKAAAEKAEQDRQKFLDESLAKELEGITNSYAKREAEILNSNLKEEERTKALTDLKIQQLENVIQATKDAGKDTSQLEKQLAETRVKINDDANKKKEESDKESAEKRKEILLELNDFVANTIKSSLDLIQQSQERESNSRIKAFEKEKEARLKSLQKEVEVFDATKAQELAIEDEFNRKIEEEKKKQFENNKKYKIVQATIDGASAVVKILSETPDPTGIFTALRIASAAATTAFQIAQIQSQKYEPGFAEGGLVTGPGSGTSDSIKARLSNGEFVVNAKSTEQFLPILQAINNGTANSLSTSNDKLEQILTKLEARINSPLKSYVLAGDVTSAQQIESKIKNQRKL